jgi:hypothetical protein
MNIQQQIADLCEETDHILWNAYSNEETSHLIFPHYRLSEEDLGQSDMSNSEGKIRVSEQEARFAFVKAICQGTLKYSIEVPTKKTYKFTTFNSDGKGRSAQTDLALLNCGRERICNIEFKSKGITDKSTNEKIGKDIQKLLREKPYGLWFHILESSDNSTLSNLIKVISDCINDVRSNFTDIDSPGLSVHICVIKHAFSIHCDLTEFHINNFDYEVSRSLLKSGDNANGWRVYRSRQGMV